MARQRTKSIADIRSQIYRIQNMATEGLRNGRYNTQQFDARRETASRAMERYSANIANSPSYQNTVRRMNRANANLTGMALINADRQFVRQNYNRQYSRSAYMGGIKRAGGSKG